MIRKVFFASVSAGTGRAACAALVGCGARVGCAALVACAALVGCTGHTPTAPEAPSVAQAPVRTTAEVLAAAADTDWRPLDPGWTLYLDLDAGRVVLELSPTFAPGHVANLLTLVRAGYFDGLSIVRSQDNYVVQWGDPHAEEPTQKRSLGKALTDLPAEYTRTSDLPFTPLPDGDVYAPQTGWSDSMPAARDPEARQAWPVHCYGMVGVGRNEPPDTGTGAELYVVTGHSPRHLDRNLAVVGRVVQGMDLLSTLPRGTEALGFYAKPEQRVPIRSVRLAADLPAAQQLALEVMRTDTATWQAFVASRRTRREGFFVEPTGRVEVCNVWIPVRKRP